MQNPSSSFASAHSPDACSQEGMSAILCGFHRLRIDAAHEATFGVPPFFDSSKRAGTNTSEPLSGAAATPKKRVGLVQLKTIVRSLPGAFERASQCLVFTGATSIGG